MSGSSARRSARVLAFLTCSNPAVGAAGLMVAVVAAVAAVSLLRVLVSRRYPVVENCTRFDFVEVVEVFEAFEVFDAVIGFGTGMSKPSSRSSARSRCS